MTVVTIPSSVYYQLPFLVAYQSTSVGHQVPAVSLQVGCHVGSWHIGALPLVNHRHACHWKHRSLPLSLISW